MTRAAEKGHVKAQFSLAELYGTESKREFREITKKYLPTINKEKADYYLKMAAHGGYALAQVALAYKIYNEGNIEEAIGWYEKAADAGNSQAQFYLGLHYTYSATEEYKDTAIYWLEKAALQEHYTALSILVERMNKEVADYNIDVNKYNEYLKED